MYGEGKTRSCNGEALGKDRIVRKRGRERPMYFSSSLCPVPTREAHPGSNFFCSEPDPWATGNSTPLCLQLGVMVVVVHLGLLLFLMFISFWETDRQTECEQGRARGRGRHRSWSRLQALSCQHRARHEARTHGPRDHDLSWRWMLKQLSHPGTTTV